jgi:hypothetical protein
MPFFQGNKLKGGERTRRINMNTGRRGGVPRKGEGHNGEDTRTKAVAVATVKKVKKGS